MNLKLKGILALSLLMISAGSFAAAIPLDDVKVAFWAAQNAGTRTTDQDALAERQALEKAGFTKQGGTTATVLTGGCGFGGCDYTYLVSTAYLTPGADPSVQVVAGIVEYQAAGQIVRLRRILKPEVVASLLK